MELGQSGSDVENATESKPPEVTPAPDAAPKPVKPPKPGRVPRLDRKTVKAGEAVITVDGVPVAGVNAAKGSKSAKVSTAERMKDAKVVRGFAKRILDTVNTRALKAHGFDVQWDSDDPAMTTTVIVGVMMKDGMLVEHELPIVDAVAYCLALMGIRTMLDAVRWLEDHPMIAGVIGLVLVSVQNGLHVRAVAMELDRRRQERAARDAQQTAGEVAAP